jgi:hypothetical protein
VNRRPSAVAAAAAVRKSGVPALVIRLPLEGGPALQLDVATYEDEQRLRIWLRRAEAVPYLAVSVDELLHDLDEEDAA